MPEEPTYRRPLIELFLAPELTCCAISALFWIFITIAVGVYSLLRLYVIPHLIHPATP